MLDLQKYQCLGEALRAALDRWPDEVCLIEADRDREKARFTYRQFEEAALPLARAFQDAGFQYGTRAAIIMTNQSKWLISAYAIFFCGGVLVPLGKLPHGLADGAKVFPAAALSGGLHALLGSGQAAPGESWVALAVWALVAPTAAALTFRWE